LKLGLHISDFTLPGGPPELVLRGHCEAVGRNCGEIEKTVLYNFDVREKGERAGQIVEDLRRLAGLGAQAAVGSAVRVSGPTTLEVIGEEVIPAIAGI
jgi:hypothetical protein